jgi:hypothetical protein
MPQGSVVLRAFAVIAEFVLWAIIACITATVLARGQDVPGGFVAAEPQARTTAGSSCLSREQIHGGHPRFRVVGGRRCWHVAKRSASAKSNGLHVDPEDDPIWRAAAAGRIDEASGTSAEISDAQTQARNCDQQILKLLDPEEMKQGGVSERAKFMKGCMSSEPAGP